MGDFLDIKKAKTNKQIRRINIDFPMSFLERIDKEARKIGVARRSLINLDRRTFRTYSNF